MTPSWPSPAHRRGSPLRQTGPPLPTLSSALPPPHIFSSTKSDDDASCLSILMRIKSNTVHKALSTTQAHGKHLINIHLLLLFPHQHLQKHLPGTSTRGLVTPDSGAFHLHKEDPLNDARESGDARHSAPNLPTSYPLAHCYYNSDNHFMGFSWPLPHVTFCSSACG